MAAKTITPSIAHEMAWQHAGYPLVAGVDEAGRGAWAGPVAAAAVILPAWEAIPPAFAAVADSKLLDAATRERLFAVICAGAISFGVGMLPAEEIDHIGILPATRAAMQMALAALEPPAQVILIDAVPLADPAGRPQAAIIKGDQLCLSIAAASILAKVSRDRWMRRADAEYPGYGLAQHKGYGTAQHAAALRALGPCALHRRSYAPVAESVAARAGHD
jgi:ribonuclease HII